MRAYRALLHLYPASFRAEYGGELVAAFAIDRRAAAGPLAVAALWLASVADIVTGAAAVHLDILGRDLRYALRSLRRSPAFALTAVTVVALGVGATTAAFSALDYVLLRPLPFADPSQLVKLWQNQASRGYSRMELSPGNFRDWKSATHAFDGMAAYYAMSGNLVGRGDPVRVEGAEVTPDLFEVLGAPASLGRVLTPGPDRHDAAGEVVISQALWRARFGDDPNVLGSTLILDDRQFGPPEMRECTIFNSARSSWKSATPCEISLPKRSNRSRFDPSVSRRARGPCSPTCSIKHRSLGCARSRCPKMRAVPAPTRLPPAS